MDNSRKNVDKAIKNEDKGEKLAITLLEWEKIRYKRKGYGVLIAILMNIIFLIFLPYILEKHWPDNIENQGLFYVITNFSLHKLVSIGSNLFFITIYKLEHPFFEKYRTSPIPWPWKNNANWKQQLQKTLSILFINHFIIIPIIYIPNIIWNISPVRLDKETIPSYFEIIWQLLFCVIIEDSVFYWTHSLLHHPFFYKRIHKVHHEYNQSVSFGAEYSHPLEYVFGNIISTETAPLLLGSHMHIITYWMHLIMSLTESIDAHSGYDFSWSPHRLLPFAIGAEFHIFHHLLFNGNYGGPLNTWDRVNKTVNKSYIKYFEEKAKLTNNEKDKTD